MVRMMRILCGNGATGVTARILVGFALISGLNSFAKDGETAKAEFPFAAPKRAFQLDYPALPQEITDRIKGVKKTAVQPSKLDAALGRDWALVNIGFFEAFSPLVQPTAAGTQPCSPSIVVAVIDTGVDYTHPELKDSIWVNSGETGAWEPPSGMAALGYDCHDKSCNGIDDDGDGFIDDVVGWDFVHDVPLPYDTHGHGTHISGIISAASANGLGTTGVCPRVTIMPLKYYDNSGAGYNNLNNTVRAIQYAVKMGAHIINYSGGGSDPAPSERAAVAEARKKGILFIAAAGNEGRNNDRIPYYPASYGLDNIVSVASVNKKNELLSSSNYGKTVHVAAPGMMILSTLPSGRFGTMSGTSQATAFVTGEAALLASQLKDDPRSHYSAIREWVLTGSKPLKGNDQGALVSGGLISVPMALGLEKKASITGSALAAKPIIQKNPSSLALAPERIRKKK